MKKILQEPVTSDGRISRRIGTCTIAGRTMPSRPKRLIIFLRISLLLFTPKCMPRGDISYMLYHAFETKEVSSNLHLALKTSKIVKIEAFYAVIYIFTRYRAEI